MAASRRPRGKARPHSRVGAAALVTIVAALGVTVITPSPAIAVLAAGSSGPGARIGDLAWLDTNGDGVQGQGEPGIAGVICTLTDADGAVLDHATTDSSGAYAFDGVPTDSVLTITCDASTATGLPAGIVPTDLTVTVKGAGDDPESDSNAAPDQTMVVLTGEADDDSIDIGYTAAATSTPPTPPAPPTPPVSPVPPRSDVSVGDYAFFDANADGVQDASDSPIQGVVATVIDAAGDPVGTATTNVDGKYAVSGLTPSTPYAICFDVTGATGLPAGVLPSQLVATLQMQTDDPTADSDIDPTDCASFTATATPDGTLDAGFTQTTS